MPPKSNHLIHALRHELLALVLQTLQRHLRLLASSVAWTRHDRNVGPKKTTDPKVIRIPVLEVVSPVCFPVEIVKTGAAEDPLPDAGRTVRILSGAPVRFRQTLRARH